MKDGRNGKLNGKGYCTYEKGSRPKPDPTVLPIIEKSRKLANIMPDGQPVSLSDQEIVEMIKFPVVNEACRVMEEGIVLRASDLDVASILGMSFPSYRGGLIFWADSVGATHIFKSQKMVRSIWKLLQTIKVFGRKSKKRNSFECPGLNISNWPQVAFISESV
ncbi:hypothetical protein MKW92_004513 [Papaver armeniacum]|nr:hypothetical protein MKW92_004513 [Papaver armeniacum]